jgi:RNA polymerase sigma factor (sigma-70 family)
VAVSRSNPLVRYVRNLASPGAPDACTDGQLLERYAVGGDPAAFAALVERHGPMVLGVCRRALRDRHDAEDAFQATFLVLIRKARAIEKPGSLGSWLHGVAYRVAGKAKAQAARRRAREPFAARAVAVDGSEDVVWRDLRAVLDAEVDALPERYRAPLVLCYLEGKTNAEAARLLGWPRGTVATRLARARERLRSRLARRGLAPAAALLPAALSRDAGWARPPAALVDSITRDAAAAAARGATAGLVSARAATLAGGVMNAMLIEKVWVAAAAVFVAGVVGLGAFLPAPASHSRRGDQSEAAPPAPVKHLPPQPAPSELPTVAQLIDYLNRNALQVETLVCEDVTVDCRQKLQSIGFKGRLAFRRPGQFRFVAQVLGKPAVDLGSSGQESWLWAAQPPSGRAYLIADTGAGRDAGRWPFPFPADWLVTGLGLAEYDPAESYRLVDRGHTLELAQQTKSPQGQDVRKVIVFNRYQAPVQVPQFILQDARTGKEICSARIREVQQAGGATVPRRLELSWPSEQVRVSVRLAEPRVNAPIRADQADRLFTRPVFDEH